MTGREVRGKRQAVKKGVSVKKGALKKGSDPFFDLFWRADKGGDERHG